MADRDKVAELAKQRQEDRDTEQKRETQERADEEARQRTRLETEKAKTAEVLAYLKDEYGSGWQLPSGHDVKVDMMPIGRHFSMGHTIPHERGEFASLTIQHWGDETNDFEGQIPIVQARYHEGDYRLITANENERYPDMDTLRDAIVKELGGMDMEGLKPVFAAIRKIFPGR